ncbi:MAG: glycine/sarcosine/betaine reductase component B subunit [Dehalococcoidia bacterium]|nr:glycine/sarcosine/betaine reductase component B subunit [Dehalococcoidia bacterium]
MHLEMGTFPVKNIVFGSRTRWDDGVLELDADELLGPILAEPSIETAMLEIGKPGESTRIINYHDILEPRIKVEGPAMTYPGRCGRPADTVGSGRTHRLGGMTIMTCVDDPNVWAARGWSVDQKDDVPRPGRGKPWSWQRFVDMSGSGALLPYASTYNLCLALRLKGGLDSGNSSNILQSAILSLSDKLAETTLGLTPPEVEVFDLTEKDPSLPGVVLSCHLASQEARVGPRSAHGTAIYGVTRLSAPWVLGPTEMMDGAVTAGAAHVTWPFTNNPIMLGLARRHGKTLNFLGCIIGRTNWGAEEEMRLAGNRAAEAARLMGASGAIVTNDVRGRRFVDSISAIQAYERVGIKTVFVTEEEDNEDGNAPPFLYHPAEMAGVVSTGTGRMDPFPSVDRVIGGVDGVDPAWYLEQPYIQGRYGAAHVRDHYGVGRQSCIDY